jgi:hypothetical protein
MTHPRTIHLARLLAWLCLCSCASAWAAELVGRIEDLRGEVTAQQPEGALRPLAVGAEVYLKDRLETGADAFVRVRFADEARTSLGEQSRLVVEDFKVHEQESSFVLRVVKGFFRVVTGQIARLRPKAVLVRTSVAAIGVRGTDFGGEVAETSAVIVLLDPEDAGRKTAIEVFNDFGRVTIDQADFGTEIPDAFSPPSPPRLMRLRSIEGLIRSVQSIQRIPRIHGR